MEQECILFKNETLGNTSNL